MNSDQPDWRAWVQVLQRWGIIDETATILEAAGPFRLIIAQFLYFGEPFFPSASKSLIINQIGSLLENPDEVDNFISLLRQDSSH